MSGETCGPAGAKGAVTAALSARRREGHDVFSELMPLVCDELRQVARRQLAREHRQHTLNTTGLIHEGGACAKRVQAARRYS